MLKVMREQISPVPQQIKPLPYDVVALVLQCGGALGAYQAGVYEGLHEAGIRPNWLAGISIGALNAAIIAGSPEGERVELEISGGPEWVAHVRDHGSGVDPAIRERLFERFATTRHGDGGTGLGLAIVRAVAELHGGHAELRETGPRGSVFTLSLPRA